MKYAISLKHVLGRKVSISLAHSGKGLNSIYGYGEEYFDNVTRRSTGSLRSFVREAVNSTRPDIIHSHNPPDSLTIEAARLSKRVPLIHDTHEVLSIHHSGYFARDNEESILGYAVEEKTSNEQSDARVYATEGIRRHIQGRYAVSGDNDLVFLNYVSRDDLPKSFQRKISERDGETHIAYVGCVTSLLRDSHYYLLNIFKELASQRLNIHIHPTSNLITRSNRAYRNLAAKNPFIHYHEHMHRRRLLEQLTRYDYGWVGLNMARNKEHLDIAIPNKLMEYLACGLPVLAFPHDAISRFINEHGIGLVGKDIQDITKQLKKLDISKLNSKVEKSKQSLVMEEKIGELITLYQSLI